MTYRKTPIAARELGIPYHTLIGLLRYNKMAPPDRDSSGDYVWTEKDMERARKVLAAMHQRRGKRALRTGS
jgi:hypothetical protein